MPIDNAQVMKQRAEDFNNFNKTASSLEELLNKSNVIAFAHKNRKNIQEIANGRYIWGSIKLFVTNIFSGDLWRILFKIPTILEVYNNINKPEMQKLLVEQTSLLEQVGKNKEEVKGLLSDLVFTEQDHDTLLKKQLANATLDLLGDKTHREKLKKELVNNYFKFSINSFDRDGFITNFINYEKSQITDKIKDELGLIKLLQAKSDIRLGNSNYNLKKIVKSLGASPTKQEISDTLKTQLTKELYILGLSTGSINTLLPDSLELSLKGAQEILQNQYKLVLDKKISQVSQAIGDEIRQNGSIDNFDHYIEGILREHAAYVVDVQEPLYQQYAVDDYIRFHQENDSPKTVDELREEAIEISYGLAPDYMRLTQNVLRIVDSLPNQNIESANPNLKTVLQKKSREIITFAKSFIGDSGPLRDTLTSFGITDEVLDLAPLVLSEGEGISKIANVTESIRKKLVFEWAEDILNLLNSNTELQQKFIDNPVMAGNITKGIINNIPFLKNLCQDLGCTDEVFDVISILVKTPEQTQILLGHLNKGEYLELTQKFIEIANSNSELRDYLTSHKEVYKNLVVSLFKEIDIIRDMKTSYGITDNELGEILDSALGILDNPGKFNELIEIFNQVFEITNQYMRKNSISKFSDLAKNDYVELSKLLLQDDRLLDLLKDNKEAVGKFAKLLTEKIPALRTMKTTYLGDVPVDNLVSNIIESGILKNTKNINLMLDRYSGNGYKIVDIFRYIYSGAPTLKNLLSIAPVRKYFSSPSVDQTLANSIKDMVNSNTTANSLSELLTSSNNANLNNLGNTKKLDGIVLDSINFSKVKKIHGFSLTSSQLSRAGFQNVEIISTSFTNSIFKNGANFENSNLQNVDFSNSTFLAGILNTSSVSVPVKISFRNARLQNVNFANIYFGTEEIMLDTIHPEYSPIITADMINLQIDFEGAILDPATLDSLIDLVKNNPELKDKINLVGAKVVGDLSERDLSNLDLEGIDLSGVTSLKGTILKNANLKSTNINPELLKESLQLEGIQTDFSSDELDDIKEEQNQNRESVIVKTISKLIVNKLIASGKLVVKDATQANLLIEKLNTKLLTEIGSLQDSERQFLFDLLEENYYYLNQFTIDSNTIIHYSHLEHKPQAILTTLFNNAFTGTDLSDLNLANALKFEYMKNLLADEVGRELFGDGQNRGKDFLIIRNHLANVFDSLSDQEKVNLYEQICTVDDNKIKLNKSDECKLLIQSLKNQYYDKTRYTKAGIITSGIYIPSADALDEFLSSDVNKMKSISNSKEISILSQAVGEKIGEKLFGTSMSSSRQSDTQKIVNYLNNHVFPNIFSNLPETEKDELLDNINNNLSELVERLVGDFNRATMLGAKTVDKNSLSQLFYNATSYTTVGSVTSGVQLNSTKLNTQEFYDSVTNCVLDKCHQDSVKVEELSSKIGHKLGETLFGDDMSDSRQLDTQKIVNALKNTIIPNILKNLTDPQKEQLLNTHDVDTLVGSYSKKSTISGFWSATQRKESLSQIFYDHSSYTKAGYATGGIQISDTELGSRAFLDKVQNHIQDKALLSNGRGR